MFDTAPSSDANCQYVIENDCSVIVTIKNNHVKWVSDQISTMRTQPRVKSD